MRADELRPALDGLAPFRDLAEALGGVSALLGNRLGTDPLRLPFAQPLVTADRLLHAFGYRFHVHAGRDGALGQHANHGIVRHELVMRRRVGVHELRLALALMVRRELAVRMRGGVLVLALRDGDAIALAELAKLAQLPLASEPRGISPVLEQILEG
jgi:hypothetical protein